MAICNAITNCTCCSLLTWDYTIPAIRHYIDPKRDYRKAGGVLIYNGRVLIIQSRADKWGFPKGGFEKGETAIQCAEREVHEETSFNVRFSDDDLKVKYNDTTFYVKHLQNEPPEIDTQYLKTPGNDCTGIGWVRLTCLKRLVKQEKRINYDVVERLNTLSINEEEPPPRLMQFNAGVRKFVKQYMGRVNNGGRNAKRKQM
jgi:8-oxo-dGTP pyrophosphatase MutT (NUDIX family)